MFSEDIIQKIKEESDIVDIVSEVTPLRRAGRNYIGRCPFHSEKTPSFTVSPDKQIYKCFGCGEAGNAISFIMKTRNLAFPDAIKILAEKIGIEIEDDSGNKETKAKYNRMYDINVTAARYFYANLKKSNNPYSYLKNRGINDRIITKFGLGYALDNWHGIQNYLKNRGFSENEILALGLTVKNEKGNIYDRFRNRIIFPVFDVNGRVIGFGGRVLDDSKPKYLNSPETVLFKKGIHLYGLNIAIKNNQHKYVIMVEGYMDVISLFQQGVTNVVATLGTALTEKQSKLLKRYFDKVIISFDADLAGQNATMRGLEILKKHGFDIRVLQIPKGKDPDEYVRDRGREEFLKLVDNALPLIDYRLKKAEVGINFSSKEMIIRYTKEVSEILSSLDTIEKAVYIKQVSQKTGISEEAILEATNEKTKKNIKNERNVNINEEFRQKLYLEPAYIKAERTLLKLCFKETLLEKVNKLIKSEDFITEGYKFIYDIINNDEDSSIENKFKNIENEILRNSEYTKDWIKLQELNLNIEESNIEKMIKDCIKELKKYRLEETKKEIMKEIKLCESKGLIEKSLRLAKELMEIQKEISII